MRGTKVFSKIDLSSRYHQVRIKEEDIHKTTFQTWYGHYEFIVVSFGLSNALTMFTCLMNSSFNKYIDKFMLVFLDDILFYYQNEVDHGKHIGIVLQVQREK